MGQLLLKHAIEAQQSEIEAYLRAQGATLEIAERKAKIQLKGLTGFPRWVSHLSCIRSGTDYLGLDLDWAWLYGCTGHAFILNVEQTACPSGPTAWNTEILFHAAPHLSLIHI